MYQGVVLYTHQIKLLFPHHSEQMLYRELQILRTLLNLPPHAKVPVGKFCKYYGLDEAEVREKLR